MYLMSQNSEAIDPHYILCQLKDHMLFSPLYINIEKFCLFIITSNNYIVIALTSTGMVMFSQNLLNTIGTRKRSDRPKQEITCEC